MTAFTEIGDTVRHRHCAEYRAILQTRLPDEISAGGIKFPQTPLAVDAVDARVAAGHVKILSVPGGRRDVSAPALRLATSVADLCSPNCARAEGVPLKGVEGAVLVYHPYHVLKQCWRGPEIEVSIIGAPHLVGADDD